MDDSKVLALPCNSMIWRHDGNSHSIDVFDSKGVIREICPQVQNGGNSDSS